MSKRRWIYFSDGTSVEVGDDYVPEPRRGGDSLLWNDRLYQDDGDPRYHSRAQHREYMRRNGLTTADDFTETWKRDAARKKIDPSRKQDLVEALHKVQSGYKPKIQRQGDD